MKKEYSLDKEQIINDCQVFGRLDWNLAYTRVLLLGI